MSVGIEIQLRHPVEIDGVTYDKLTATNMAALVNFQTHNAPAVIRSLSLVFAVPRRVVRHLHPDDANRACDMLCALLDEAARPYGPTL